LFVAVDFVADTVSFVASVSGVKASWSTLSIFHKVDRVEFNFVAGLYRALLVLVQVSVAELTGAGVNVLTVSATDSDSADNGRVTYSMLPLDSFNISATTGNTHLYARQSTTGSTHLYMLQSPIQVTLTCTHDSLLQVTLTCTGCSHRYR